MLRFDQPVDNYAVYGRDLYLEQAGRIWVRELDFGLSGTLPVATLTVPAIVTEGGALDYMLAMTAGIVPARGEVLVNGLSMQTFDASRADRLHLAPDTIGATLILRTKVIGLDGTVVLGDEHTVAISQDATPPTLSITTPLLTGSVLENATLMLISPPATISRSQALR